MKVYSKDFSAFYGTLDTTIEALVEEERNGLFELSFIILNTDNLFNYIKEDNIVVANANDTLLNQKFRIYMTRKLMNNRVEVFARHISFDLMYDYVDSISFENQSCEYALNQLFRQSNFSTHYRGYSDIINAQNYNISMCNILEAIAGKEGSVIDTFGNGAELLRDNENISVLNRRGWDNEVTIEYRKNLTGFELEEDTTDLVTRIRPYAKYTKEGSSEEVLVKADYVDSPYINNYSHPFIRAIDYSDKFEDGEVPTLEKLVILAQNEYRDNKVDIPKQNYKIEFVPLSKCVGYEAINDRISLCDIVTIKDTRYGIDTQSKVIKCVFNVLKNRYESIELGEPKTSLGDIIGNGGNDTPQVGPPGPQGPPGQDGNIGDFPDSLPQVPILESKVYGFANIELLWSFENKVYYSYEVYASKTKGFTPNTFNRIHEGQTSTYMYQAKPNETWYFKVCAINSYGNRTGFSNEVEVATKKIDDMTNYFEEAAIGRAVVGSLTADYMEAGIIKGNWIDARQLSVTDGNGKRTLDIDSFGNINGDFTNFTIKGHAVAQEGWVNTQISNTATGIKQEVSDNYTNKSVFNQMVDRFEYDFENSIGSNYIPNSGLKNGLYGWYLDSMQNVASDNTYEVRDSNNFISGKCMYFYAKTLVQGACKMVVLRDFDVSMPSGLYTLSCLANIFKGSYKLTLRVWDNNKDWNLLKEVVLDGIHGKCSNTFEIFSNGGYARLYIEALGNENANTQAISVQIGDLKLESGNIATKWRGNSDELYAGRAIIDSEGMGVKHYDDFESKLTPRELYFRDNLGRKHMSLYKASIMNYDWTAEERFLGKLSPTILPINQGEAGMSYLSSQFGKYFVLGLDNNVMLDTDEFLNVQHFFRVNYQELGGSSEDNRVGTHILSHPLYCHTDLKTMENIELKEGKELRIENGGVIKSHNGDLVLGANKTMTIGAWNNNAFHGNIFIKGVGETESNTYWDFKGYTMYNMVLQNQYSIDELNLTEEEITNSTYIEKVDNDTVVIDTSMASKVLIEENSKLSSEQDYQNESIALVEDAVNTILMGVQKMSTLSVENNENNGGSGMGSYLGNQIYKGKLEYDAVIAKYPQYKEDIDAFLEKKLNEDGIKFK